MRGGDDEERFNHKFRLDDEERRHTAGGRTQVMHVHDRNTSILE
jgi:hypothetical protein